MFFLCVVFFFNFVFVQGLMLVKAEEFKDGPKMFNVVADLRGRKMHLESNHHVRTILSGRNSPYVSVNSGKGSTGREGRGTVSERGPSLPVPE